MFDLIEKQIIDELEKVPAKAISEGCGRRGEKSWNKYSKQAIVDVIRRNGYTTCARKECDSDKGAEWLYDVLWYQSDEQNRMIDVPLSAEVEFGRFNAIRDDFEKLLVTRTKYREMVFQTRNDKEMEEFLDVLEDFIMNCKLTRTDDRYLFIVWVKDHWASKCFIA